jgi:hypothetical protein
VRQVLSWRFVAAIGALCGLALVVYLLFVDDDSIAQVIDEPAEQTHRADIVSLVYGTSSEGFAMSPGGFSQGELTMVLVPIGLDAIEVPIHPGTPGVVTCPDLTKPCALLAETLGDTIVWFALVPLGPNFRFELPAIESLDGGYAHLVNGWEVRYADILDRSRCEDGEPTDVPAESFSEFLRLSQGNHRSLFDLGRGELIAVVC